MFPNTSAKPCAFSCQYKSYPAYWLTTRSQLGYLELIAHYHWHHHDDEDEFFYVVEGRFIVDLENRSVELQPRQGIVVPKGVRHRTRAPERTVILMMEGAGIIPTGD